MNTLGKISAFIAANYVKYGPTVVAIATGAALIAAKDYGPGVTMILQALLAASVGTSALQLHAAVHAVPTGVLDAARRHD